MNQDVFSSLSTELLVNLFLYLDLRNLCNLRLTCKRFRDVIDTWAYPLIIKEKSKLIVTNQENDQFSRRCRRQLKILEKIFVSRNWENGYYKERCFMSLYGKEIFMPWLHFNRDFLWCSRANDIFQFKRTNRSLVNRPVSVVKGSSVEDVTRYNVKNDNLIAGRRDGSILLWSVNEKRIKLESWECHNSDINCVDITPDARTIVSGSRDNTLKIWNVNNNLLEEKYCENLGEPVWTTTLSDSTSKLAVGTSWTENHKSLLVYDLDRFPDHEGFSSENDRYGSGILDVKWDGFHNVWSCGYDGYLKRWDLRTGKCEQSFQDPCGDVLYCFDIDHYNTAVTGAQVHSRITLWDTRQSQCVQLYFLKKNRSPVYSVAFDAEHLFAAADRSLNMLDFHSRNGEHKDYKYFLNYKYSSN